MLFLVFVNDFFAVFFSECLQSDIDILYNCSSSWGMLISVSKCTCLCFFRSPKLLMVPSYSLGQDYIPNRDNYKYQGIIIDVTWKFHQHINISCGKVSRVTQSILHETVYRSVEFIKAASITRVRSLLVFSSIVWATGFLGDLHMLERV